MQGDDGVRVAVASAAALGESPVWHPVEQVLYYTDIPGRRLQRFDPRSGELRHWDFDVEVGSLAPRLRGGLLLAMRDGVWRFDPSDGARSLLAAAPYDTATTRFNDGKCDPQGRFWVGSIYEPRDPPRAHLYCFDQGVLSARVPDITVLNGLAWSPDGRTMHWSDTKAHTIYAADFEPTDGSLSRVRPFARFEPRQPGQPLDLYGGRPDGAAMDAEGAYWVAMFEGQRLLRLGPDGQVLREVRLPVRCPTMPCFGGSDLKTLYVTTARQNRPADELLAQPLAGCVLALDVEVPGLPAHLAMA